MLRTDLLEIINRGGVWAFVGSGASVDAGCPTWRELIDKILEKIDGELRNKILSDHIYKSAYDEKIFSRCFSRIEHHTGREQLEASVRFEIRKAKVAGGIIKRLADWPFAGYITTNYDQLLEIGLQGAGERGWSIVGNSPAEVRKVSGDAPHVVWHIHGCINLSQDKSHLIITEKDYEGLYLEETPTLIQLRGLLAQHRVIFIGFGFRDPEVMRLLKRVGRLSDPARPVYGFLSGISGPKHDAERDELLEKYNVDVIPYEATDNSHGQLLELLDVYGALILRRSLKFGQPERPCPSYDPETTGLLIYNELCLKGGAGVSEDILGALLRAQVLSLLNRGPCTISDLVQDLDSRVKAIRGHVDSLTDGDVKIKKVLQELVQLQLVSLESDSGSSKVALTPKGFEMVANQAATAERLSDQFSASLQTRAQESLSKDVEATPRVARAAESFLKECIERRALGVAMTMYAWRPEHQSYQMVALLQSLPEFMAQLLTAEEAIALSSLVQAVLSRPSDAEARYIGLALQAMFGAHLLGYDPDTLRARTRELSQTLFLIDSSTLIPFLARSSIGHKSARLLIERLKTIGSIVATTKLLTEEVAEHARWAIKKTEPGTGQPKIEALKSAMGRAGEQSNLFLEGFLEEVSQGTIVPIISYYLNQICNTPIGACSSGDIERILNKEEIHCFSFDEWQGFTTDLWSERDYMQEEIGKLRLGRGTFKHERQVKAEAEALIIIRNLRVGAFKIKEKDVSNAYFISHTRIIDEVASAGLPITMRPESALQLATTLSPCTLEELSFLTNSLLLELSERNLAVVDKLRLQRAFSPLIAASKEKLAEEMDHHRALISQRYGEPAVKAFNESSSLDVPIVLESYNAQKAEELTKKLVEEEKRRQEAETIAKLSRKDREELERLRMEKKLRQKKALAKKRAALSRKGKKRHEK